MQQCRFVNQRVNAQITSSVTMCSAFSVARSPHAPPLTPLRLQAFTIQSLNAALLAERCSIDVVCDFRLSIAQKAFPDFIILRSDAM